MYSFISYLISKCFHLDSFMKTWLFKSGFTTKDSPCMIIPGSHYGTLSLDQNCFTKITVIFRYLFMLTSFYHVSFKTTKILLLLGSTGTSIFEKWFFCFCFFFFSILYFSSVQLLHCVRLFGTSWTAAHQASITNSQSLLRLMSIQSVMPPNHLILCCPLLLMPPIFPSIRVFSNKSVLHIRWLKY